MVKRRVVEESEEEEVSSRASSPPQPKRAKREGKVVPKDEFDASGSQGDADMREREGDEEMDDDSGEQPQDEATFEEKNEQLIRAAISKKVGRVTIAQSGVIHSLSLKNFMCHRHLSFAFCPQVTFIAGRNGSGKSAVLAGIQIGLGARTFNTGRGAGLKAFIQTNGKQGEPITGTAEITIRIRNGGSEAYKPEIYGDMITVVRRFSEKSSSWSIKNADGKTVGTSRRDLQEITDAMNIQIDSPLNVLTQDVAKQFLANSTPTDKYTFFLRGTQLAQLSEEYEVIRESSLRNDKFILAKKEILPTLVAAHKEAERKRTEATKARAQADTLAELKREQAWAHVAGKNKELTKIQREYDAQLKVQQSVIKKKDEAEVTIAEHEDRCKKAEAEIPGNEELDNITAERTAIQEQIRQNKNKISEFKSGESQINSALADVKAAIAEANRQIDAEKNKENDDKAEEKARIRQQIEQVRLQMMQAETDMEDSRNQRGQAEQLANELQEAVAKAKQDYAKQERTAQDMQGQIGHWRSIEKNKLAAFGNNIDKILAEIQKRPWKGKAKPVGPLGLYVALKEKDFKEVLQIQLGNTMMSFAVSHMDDRRQLEGILNQFGNRQPIIVAEPDIFDYSNGVPKDDRVVTPLRVLTFTDEWVLRLFINAHRIERIGLAHNHQQAKGVAGASPGMNVWSADCYRVIKYPDGGGQSAPMSKLKDGDKRRALFRDSDVGTAIKEAEAKLDDVRHNMETIKSTGMQMEARQTSAQVKADEQRRREGQAHQMLNRLRREKESLDEKAKDEESVSIAALMNHREDNEKEAENLKEQYSESVKQKAVFEEANRPLVERYSALRSRRDAIELEIREHQEKLQEMVDAALKAKNAVVHYTKKLRDEEKKLDTLKLGLDKTQIEYSSWYKQASNYCDEVLNPRPANLIETQIDALTNALQRREKRHGASVEEMEQEYQRTKKAVEDADRDIKAFAELNKILKYSLNKRLDKWHMFRMSIALRAKIQFQYHLTARNFTGRLIFDHSAQTLSLRVNPEQQASSQAPKDRDPKSLSGGEKSYSQICLLLALWESIGSPIRCLDEFDVFMDNVNRRISMKLMVDTARHSEAKQYIFLSPLEISNFIEIGPDVWLKQMPDPQRGGQTSLPFEEV